MSETDFATIVSRIVSGLLAADPNGARNADATVLYAVYIADAMIAEIKRTAQTRDLRDLS